MTDPRYATPDVTNETAAPEPGPQGSSEQSSQRESEVGSPGSTALTATSDHDGATTAEAGNDTPSPSADPQATTELPRTGWGSTSTAQSGAEPEGRSKDRSADSDWSAEQTQNFPAYRPQSYPTYPPTNAQTSELPAVGAGGAPPTTAAAYGGPGPAAGGRPGPAAGGAASASAASFNPAAAGVTASSADRPRRRAGAGLAGALGLIGLAAAAYGAFALPVQKLGPRRSPYFVMLRELATQKIDSTQANAHSVSLVGGHAATLWWRYGLAGALGVLALLLLVQIWVPVLRRVAGVLLFLGALATIAGFAISVHQTNDYRSYVGGIQGTHRVPISQLGTGVWVPLAGCAVAAVGGLIAAAQSTRR